ncbi:MAG: anthranilate synthase component I [Thermodesulfovibrionales bacterium]|nr:anthranilate synthase component I [Thermodesulfovibrionales bacterium]
MIRPDIGEFKSLASKGNLIPIYREILADTDTPVSAFLKLGERPSFLLESVLGGEKWARYSFLGLKPSKIIKGSGNTVEIIENGNVREVSAPDPIALLKEIMAGFRPVPIEGLPRFSGGLVGYLSYDMVRFIEELPDMGRQRVDAPDMFFMLTDTMLVFDSLRQTIKVLSNVCLDGRDPGEAYNEAAGKINAIIERLKKPLPSSPMERLDNRDGDGTPEFDSSFKTKEAFEHAVVRAKDYIMAGDAVQIVLSQRFQRPSEAGAFGIYRALRVINPSPYMYYLDTGDIELVGSSPEILVRLEGGRITLRPIAGTRKRGLGDEEDMALEKELRADEKERAEHIMLVDLGRNDVGRVARTGSVKVTELMNVERYSHVMHMVSNVEGELTEGLDSYDVLRACFPAGTVTGAPKVRAMEIIEELEPVRRGPYAGTVGYLSYSGNMDTCITIRTLLIKDGVVYIQAGAGIVADSVPEMEYAETVNKAMGMMRAVEMAERSLKG